MRRKLNIIYKTGSHGSYTDRKRTRQSLQHITHATYTRAISPLPNPASTHPPIQTIYQADLSIQGPHSDEVRGAVPLTLLHKVLTLVIVVDHDAAPIRNAPMLTKHICNVMIPRWSWGILPLVRFGR